MLRTSRSRWFTVPLKTPSLLVITAIAGLALSACSGAHGSSVAAGTLDSGFGAGGKSVTDFGGKSDVAKSIAVESDGKIVVVGSAKDPAQGDDFVVLRSVV
ncbi:hypothetical protein ACFYUD_19880 [Nocardia tengchongensis]|uniref:hypothetical protein n=1 Tax=Nocardia tengchongensis TaxID=2055889 RepID=UPI0036920CE6